MTYFQSIRLQVKGNRSGKCAFAPRRESVFCILEEFENEVRAVAVAIRQMILCPNRELPPVVESMFTRNVLVIGWHNETEVRRSVTLGTASVACPTYCLNVGDISSSQTSLTQVPCVAENYGIQTGAGPPHPGERIGFAASGIPLSAKASERRRAQRNPTNVTSISRFRSCVQRANSREVLPGGLPA